jgi:hypothetical protein
MMAKLTLKDWLYAQHVPPEVMADIDKLFALPDKLDNQAGLVDPGMRIGMKAAGEALRAILGIEQSKR